MDDLITMPNGLLARPNTSDEGTWHDVFDDDRAWHRPPSGTYPRMIFDMGAYVGYTSYDYWKRYPSARIFALEPDVYNFDLLLKNLYGTSVVAESKALVYNRYITGYIDQSLAPNAKRFVENPTVSAVPTTDLELLYGEAYVDFLKLDIEGAEREILKRGGNWVDRTGCINVEVHNDYLPEEAIHDLEDLGFDVTVSDSLPWSLTGVR